MRRCAADQQHDHRGIVDQSAHQQRQYQQGKQCNSRRGFHQCSQAPRDRFERAGHDQAVPDHHQRTDGDKCRVAEAEKKARRLDRAGWRIKRENDKPESE